MQSRFPSRCTLSEWDDREAGDEPEMPKVHSHKREAERQRRSSNQLLYCGSSTFGSNDDAGVEDQSHRFSSGSGWLLMTASRSRANPPSSVAVEPCSFARRRDSESRRKGRSAATCSTTAGEDSFSMTISSPARTRASRLAKSRAASASEMWTTAIFLMIPAGRSDCHSYLPVRVSIRAARPLMLFGHAPACHEHPPLPGRSGVPLRVPEFEAAAMRDLVVNPTAFSHLSARVEESANVGLPACNYGGGRGSSFGVFGGSNVAALAMNFRSRGADETLLRHGSAVRIPSWNRSRLRGFSCARRHWVFCFG